MKKLIEFLVFFAGWSNRSNNEHDQSKNLETSKSNSEELKTGDNEERPQEVPSDNYPMF